MKELGAQWLVKMVQYIEDNPQFVVNGFVKAGISMELDNHTVSSEASSTSSDETYSEESSDSEDSKGSTSECSSESEERSESSSEDEVIVLSD